MAGDSNGHEQAAAVVRRLVERFTSAQRAPEAGARADLWDAFLAPLFAALGWELAYGPRIDACIEGRRALIVDVIEPAAGLGDAAALALRRHAWSAGVPLAVATSFAELAVYDCGRKPAPGDDVTTARVLHLTCAEYAARWPDIAALLAREAVTRARADAPRRRRGRVAVDAALLADVDGWRRMLAQGLARRHARPDSPAGELARRTVGRILFLRMCEDRGIEPPGQLRRLAGQPGVHAAIAHLYRQAGARHGTTSDDMDIPDDMECIDDASLRVIIENLYHPECKYVFAALPASVLGQAHEHSLGRHVHVTAGGDAATLDRLDARKAGGVYYTPPHMVEHVVRHTLGAWLHGKTLRQARRVRILDPACGAGAFLLGAYQYLLHWHEQACLRADLPADRARLVRAADGTWRLGARERLRILGQSLHGVDIDAQAVQVTRQTLLIEALAGAPEAAAGEQLRMFAGPGPAVPALRRNIRRGNALVAPDFLATHGRDLDPDEAGRALVFDWVGAFPHVLDHARPGFDVVLGNPPWGQKDIAESDAVKRYVRDRFQSLRGNYDLFRPFVEQGIRLLRRGGRFGMVLPDIVLLKNYQETRRYLLDHLTLTHIDWWGMPFPDAAIDAATLVGVHERAARTHAVHVAMRAPGRVVTHAIPQADFRANDRHVFNLALTPARRAIVARLARFPRLGDCFEVHEGVHSGNIRRELFVDRAVDDSCQPLLLGRDEISPFGLRWAGRFIRMSALPARGDGARYANAGQPAWFHNDKILVRRTGDRVLAAVDREGRYASNNFFVVLARASFMPGALGLDGLCALLNSRLMTWYFRTIEPRKGRAFAELKIKHLSVFPLPDVASRPDACAALARLGVEQARLAASSLASAMDHEIGHEIGHEIDRAVYALFDFTADEIFVTNDGDS